MTVQRHECKNLSAPRTTDNMGIDFTAAEREGYMPGKADHDFRCIGSHCRSITAAGMATKAYRIRRADATASRIHRVPDGLRNRLFQVLPYAERMHSDSKFLFQQGFVNPTVQSKFLSGKCLEQGRDTFFETEASDPFESCFYRDSEANYDYVVTDSDNRVSVARVIFVKKPVLPVLMGACIMGAATCAVSDTAVRREPLIVLGPPLHYTATSDGGPYYCTAEGYTCNSPAGAKSCKVTWAATFESSSHVEKRVNAGSFKCEQQFFGATDPAPGTLKACYLSEIQYS